MCIRDSRETGRGSLPRPAGLSGGHRRRSIISSRWRSDLELRATRLLLLSPGGARGGTRLPEEPGEFRALASSASRMAVNLQNKIQALEATRKREQRFICDAAHE